jgi:hypothetical protein
VILLTSYIPGTWIPKLFFLFHCCAGQGYTVKFTNVLTTYQIYKTWIHPFIILLAPSPHCWNSFKLNHFLHIYVHSSWTIFTFPCFLHLLPPPSGTNTPTQGLFSDFVNGKMTFLFVLGSYTGSFLVTFPCTYEYNSNLFIASIFLLSTLVPFLW